MNDAAIPSAGSVVAPATSKWFSTNPDKAWAEKFYLPFLPIFFAYNALIQRMHWLDVGNFWHVTQNVLMWVPYCVALPWYLRRHSGIPWHKSFWFKFNLWMVVWVFFATYFGSEYFFSALGMRYHFPQVTLYLDSALVGPNQATALANQERVPVGMYFNAIAFFIVYHVYAVIVIRRIRNLFTAQGAAVRFAAWLFAVLATSLFFAWAETFFYQLSGDANGISYYIDVPKMIKYGSFYYMLDFVISFPNVYRLDETVAQTWSLRRCVVEASFVGMWAMFLLDLAVLCFGGIV
jgi:cycloeucalenol cycloisomerase